MIAQTARKITGFALTITVLGLLTACASEPSVNTTASSHSAVIIDSHGLGARAAAIALQQVGTPYRYGGASTSGFDCSGLVQYAYRHAGKKVPRTTGQLWGATASVQRTDIQPGDVLFFSIEGKMSHVGLYVGDQQFVHAPASGRRVAVEDLRSPFYSEAFIKAGRLR